MGEAAPEENAAWEYIDFRQNGGPCGCKSRNYLKKAVYIGIELTSLVIAPAKIKGKRAEKRHKHPGAGNDKKSVTGVYFFVFWLPYGK